MDLVGFFFCRLEQFPVNQICMKLGIHLQISLIVFLTIFQNVIQLDLGYPGHQLSGYLYYPAMILQYNIVYFQLMSCSRQNKVVKYLFYFIVYPFYTNDNLLQIGVAMSKYIIRCI